MIDIRRLVPFLIAILFLLNGHTHAVAQTSAASSKLGSIKGRVMSDGQAVTNASVTVSDVNTPRQTRAVPTNDNGEFEVKGLEPGTYRVDVSAPGYVAVLTDPDQKIYRVGESVTLNMIKGGVITGRVATAEDDPVVAVRVRALMIRDQNGRPPVFMAPVADELTDDRGVYRIYGLLPGTYIVLAGGRGFSGTGANAFDNDAPTFAPSSTRDTAEEVALAGGEERMVDIRYRAAKGYSVSGKVIAPTTLDQPWMTIHLDRIVNSTPELRTTTYQSANAKGFEFKTVADGDYQIWAEYEARGGDKLVSDLKRITVTKADVTGIELLAKPLATVAGVVVMERSTLQECKNDRTMLFAETLVSLERTKPQPARGEVSPDVAGNFQLRNLDAGQYKFYISVIGKRWYVRSVTVPLAKDSIRDLTRNLLTLKSGDRVTGLKAILTEGAASIYGQIELPEERGSGRIVFYVIPAEKDKAEEILRYFATPVADDGSFTQEHIPPGRYWTFAKLVTAENEIDTAAVRHPAAVSTRTKLRREAEAAKSELEVKPCQTVRELKLPLASN